MGREGRGRWNGEMRGDGERGNGGDERRWGEREGGDGMGR